MLCSVETRETMWTFGTKDELKGDELFNLKYVSILNKSKAVALGFRTFYTEASKSTYDKSIDEYLIGKVKGNSWLILYREDSLKQVLILSLSSMRKIKEITNSAPIISMTYPMTYTEFLDWDTPYKYLEEFILVPSRDSNYSNIKDRCLSFRDLKAKRFPIACLGLDINQAIFMYKEIISGEIASIKSQPNVVIVVVDFNNVDNSSCTKLSLKLFEKLLHTF